MKITNQSCSRFLTSHSSFKNTGRTEVAIRRELEVGIDQVHYQESNPNPKVKLSLEGGGERKREGQTTEGEERRRREGRRGKERGKEEEGGEREQGEGDRKPLKESHG